MKGVQLFFWLLLGAQGMAQTQVSGSVKDEKDNPIAGANALLQGTYDGATSLADGTFTFSTMEQGPKILQVTFMGYKPFRQTITLRGTPLTLPLIIKEEINELTAVTISAGSFTAGEEKRRTILKAVDISTTAGATADIAGGLHTLPRTPKVRENRPPFVRGGGSNETKTLIAGQEGFHVHGPS